MSLAQEKTIKNYIYQMRTAFSLQEVHENTDVPKTSAFRILHKLLENGELEKTGASVSPQRYRAVLRAPKSPKGDFDKRAERISTVRQEEVEEKAEKLGVSTRTVYRIERRGYVKAPECEKSNKPDRYLHLDEVVELVRGKGLFTASEVVEAMDCRLEQAIGALDTLVSMGKIEKKTHEQFAVRYQYVENRRIS
ncbi:helix-turn-helix domain-containing protein [Maridesulfovibrio ferrireducens]|uniref:helix-turn-helix domain-containing protein n=1 Tax=Maridesulfovibrio ferrireducens TaxID=246191 RepID=UPI001A2382F8|nr:helix-turn-helix domain-containing protein [Maridesulfovibrio ferrireducens]MBI9113226.1 helix-turn-helix domain-containing protein [Maridesulfovibrio ferrireducens]